MNALLKQPSAWIPVALALAMLVFILSYLAIFGISVPEPNGDEGVGAHLFQMWLVLEVLMVGFFAVKWLPQRPRRALLILAVQMIAVLAACAPVFYFRL